MNVNTRPAPQKHTMNSHGEVTCTSRKNRLPSAMTVDWASDTTAMTAKRPKNSCRGFGFTSPASFWMRRSAFGLNTTRMRSDPMKRASVV